jgi:hypothetical protein
MLRPVSLPSFRRLDLLEKLPVYLPTFHQIIPSDQLHPRSRLPVYLPTFHQIYHPILSIPEAVFRKTIGCSVQYPYRASVDYTFWRSFPSTFRLSIKYTIRSSPSQKPSSRLPSDFPSDIPSDPFHPRSRLQKNHRMLRPVSLPSFRRLHLLEKLPIYLPTFHQIYHPILSIPEAVFPSTFRLSIRYTIRSFPSQKPSSRLPSDLPSAIPSDTFHPRSRRLHHQTNHLA